MTTEVKVDEKARSLRPPNPIKWAATSGAAAFFWVGIYVFVRFNPWLLLGAFIYEGAMAAAGYALALARRVGSRLTIVVALIALAALPLVAGGRPVHQPWIEVADSMVPLMVIIGAGMATLLAAVAVFAAWRHRQAPAGASTPLRPALVGLASTLAVLAQMLRDFGRLDSRAVLIALAVGVGGAAVPAGLQANRNWVTVAGWVAVAAIPVVHLHPGYTAYFGFDGLGILFDFIGLWLTALAAVVAAVGIGISRRQRDAAL